MWILKRRRLSGHPFVIHCIDERKPSMPSMTYPILAAHVMRKDYTADDAKTFCRYLNERGVRP